MSECDCGGESLLALLTFEAPVSVCVVALETRDGPVNAENQDAVAEKLEIKKPPVHSFFG